MNKTSHRISNNHKPAANNDLIRPKAVGRGDRGGREILKKSKRQTHIVYIISQILLKQVGLQLLWWGHLKEKKTEEEDKKTGEKISILLLWKISNVQLLLANKNTTLVWKWVGICCCVCCFNFYFTLVTWFFFKAKKLLIWKKSHTILTHNID